MYTNKFANPITLETGVLQIHTFMNTEEKKAWFSTNHAETARNRLLSDGNGAVDILVFYFCQAVGFNDVTLQSPFKFTLFLPDSIVTS